MAIKSYFVICLILLLSCVVSNWALGAPAAITAKDIILEIYEDEFVPKPANPFVVPTPDFQRKKNKAFEQIQEKVRNYRSFLQRFDEIIPLEIQAGAGARSAYKADAYDALLDDLKKFFEKENSEILAMPEIRAFYQANEIGGAIEYILENTKENKTTRSKLMKELVVDQYGPELTRLYKDSYQRKQDLLTDFFGQITNDDKNHPRLLRQKIKTFLSQMIMPQVADYLQKLGLAFDFGPDGLEIILTTDSNKNSLAPLTAYKLKLLNDLSVEGPSPEANPSAAEGIAAPNTEKQVTAEKDNIGLTKKDFNGSLKAAEDVPIFTPKEDAILERLIFELNQQNQLESIHNYEARFKNGITALIQELDTVDFKLVLAANIPDSAINDFHFVDLKNKRILVTPKFIQEFFVVLTNGRLVSDLQIIKQYARELAAARKLNPIKTKHLTKVIYDPDGDQYVKADTNGGVYAPKRRFMTGAGNGSGDIRHGLQTHNNFHDKAILEYQQAIRTIHEDLQKLQTLLAAQDCETKYVRRLIHRLQLEVANNFYTVRTSLNYFINDLHYIAKIMDAAHTLVDPMILRKYNHNLITRWDQGHIIIRNVFSSNYMDRDHLPHYFVSTGTDIFQDQAFRNLYQNMLELFARFNHPALLDLIDNFDGILPATLAQIDDLIIKELYDLPQSPVHTWQEAFKLLENASGGHPISLREIVTNIIYDANGNVVGTSTKFSGNTTSAVSPLDYVRKFNTLDNDQRYPPVLDRLKGQVSADHCANALERLTALANPPASGTTAFFSP